MKAMIFAAGLGTRLTPITNNIPKALVEVGGKTLIQRAIESVWQVGVDEIIINVHHFSEAVIQYLSNNSNFGANIYISNESEELLDTGGGLQKVRSRLESANLIIALNVDVVTNINYSKLIAYHKNAKALATLAVRNRKSSRYFLFDEKLRLSGWQNVKNSQKILMCNKVDFSSLAFSGIQIISPELFNYMPDKQIFGMVEWYLNAAETDRIIAYLHDEDYWFDAGTIEKINSIEKFLDSF